MNSTSRIFLYGATRSATNAMISAALTSARLTTKAFGISPASVSALGITAASATAGCVSSTASSSAGATWYALYLMNSLSRSTMKKNPSASAYPTSPVWSHPSASIACAVASALLR